MCSHALVLLRTGVQRDFAAIVCYLLAAPNSTEEQLTAGEAESQCPLPPGNSQIAETMPANMLGLELWEKWLNAVKISWRGKGWQVREKENFHWQPLNLKLFLKSLSGGNGGWTLALCLKKSKKKMFSRCPFELSDQLTRGVYVLCGAPWKLDTLSLLIVVKPRGQRRRGVPCMKHGVWVTRKELRNKEGKQKSRALTVTWTEAGKSYIILSKTSLPKKPLFESWHDLCLYLLWKSFSHHLRSWDCDLIIVSSTAE